VPQDLTLQLPCCGNVSPHLDYGFGITVVIPQRICGDLEIRVSPKDSGRMNNSGYGTAFTDFSEWAVQ